MDIRDRLLSPGYKWSKSLTSHFEGFRLRPVPRVSPTIAPRTFLIIPKIHFEYGSYNKNATKYFFGLDNGMDSPFTADGRLRRRNAPSRPAHLSQQQRLRPHSFFMENYIKPGLLKCGGNVFPPIRKERIK